jgi:hypothetical protein
MDERSINLLAVKECARRAAPTLPKTKQATIENHPTRPGLISSTPLDCQDQGVDALNNSPYQSSTPARGSALSSGTQIGQRTSDTLQIVKTFA